MLSLIRKYSNVNYSDCSGKGDDAYLNEHAFRNLGVICFQVILIIIINRKLDTPWSLVDAPWILNPSFYYYYTISFHVVIKSWRYIVLIKLHFKNIGVKITVLL